MNSLNEQQDMMMMMIEQTKEDRLFLTDLMNQIDVLNSHIERLEAQLLINSDDDDMNQSIEHRDSEMKGSCSEYGIVSSILHKNDIEMKRMKQHYDERMKEIIEERDQLMKDCIESKYKFENHTHLLEQSRVK
jgi:uncharacterized FlgJ-related protein